MEHSESLIDREQRVSIDAGADRRLASLIARGIPSPAELVITGATWASMPLRLEQLAIRDDGELRATIEVPGPPVPVAAGDWKPDLLSAETAHGSLTIESGALSISKHSFGSAGERIDAVLQGWKWATMGDSTGVWWTGKLQTYSERRPIALRFIRGNALVRVGTSTQQCWRFGWPDGGEAFIFFVGELELGLLVSAPAGEPPDADRVADLLRALGFAVGEPLALGCLVQVDENGTPTGLASFWAPDDRHARHGRNQPPALPSSVLGPHMADFVDLALKALEGKHRIPLIVAMSHYFHGLGQTLDSEFIHNWIAAEGLAKIIGSSPDFGAPAGGDPHLVRDWSVWRRWVRSVRSDLEAMANPGEADRLFGRVMSMAQRDGTKVERAFRMLGLPWEPAMTDVQDIRKSAVHEGAMAGLAGPESREWEQDLRRIGILKTMLTALLAKMIGYTGPIADREKTEFNIGACELPSWWEGQSKPTWVSYHGAGTPTVEETRALLQRLEEQGARFSDPVGA